MSEIFRDLIIFCDVTFWSLEDFKKVLKISSKYFFFSMFVQNHFLKDKIMWQSLVNSYTSKKDLHQQVMRNVLHTFDPLYPHVLLLCPAF